MNIKHFITTTNSTIRKVRVLAAHSSPTLWDPMDCSLPDSTLSMEPKDQTQVSQNGRQILNCLSPEGSPKAHVNRMCLRDSLLKKETPKDLPLREDLANKRNCVGSYSLFCHGITNELSGDFLF